MNAVSFLSVFLLYLGLTAAPVAVHGCDAGVLYGQNCTQAKADAGDMVRPARKKYLRNVA
jgi:hypothetical protein